MEKVRGVCMSKEKIEILVIMVICIAILVKTGKISDALGFVLKWLLYPGIFAAIGFLLGLFIAFIGCIPGSIIGCIIGFIKVFKDASRKLQ